MGLSLDEFKAASRTKRMPCSVAQITVALSDKDREVLEAALADPDIRGSAIARVLAANGHKVSEGTLQRHRRGDCSCGSR